MRCYRKLLGFYLVAGLGLQSFQMIHARPCAKKTMITTKKVMPYYIRQKKNGKKHHPTINVQKGIASWYKGRPQKASQNLTAAHPTLPFGTRVLVHSEDTGHSVMVTINDRGPYINHRIIDLSKEAAAKIGMIHKGIAHVTITPVTNLEVAETPE